MKVKKVLRQSQENLFLNFGKVKKGEAQTEKYLFIFIYLYYTYIIYM